MAPHSLTPYGLRDWKGHSDLPSRPASAADNWGSRPDLLKLAKASEDYMITAGKLPARAKPPPPPPTPRLTDEQVQEVDRFVQAYEKRTLDRIVYETPSEMYRRILGNIPGMTMTQMRSELKKRGLHKRNLSRPELEQRLAIAYTKETRQKRLEEAHADKDDPIIQGIRKECFSFHILEEKADVAARKVDPKYVAAQKVHRFCGRSGLQEGQEGGVSAKRASSRASKLPGEQALGRASSWASKLLGEQALGPTGGAGGGRLWAKRAASLGGCRGETPRTPPTAGEVAHVMCPAAHVLRSAAHVMCPAAHVLRSAAHVMCPAAHVLRSAAHLVYCPY
jgi:hypothetical protein